MRQKKLYLIIILTISLFIITIVIGLLIYSKGQDNKTSITDNSNRNVPSIINECDQKLDNIPIIGMWEYQGEETSYWKLELHNDSTLTYSDKEEGQSEGKWEYNEESNSLSIQFVENFDYWDTQFFNDVDFITNNINGVLYMDKETHVVEFQIKEHSNVNCTYPYKSINFFGWNFNKSE